MYQIRYGVSVLLSCGLFAGIASGQCADVPDNPKNDIEGAQFGFASVMSADGTIALASGPGFDQGDGLVRSFERVNGEWQEGLAYGAMLLFGDQFGWSMAMNDAGTRAIITAPREPVFVPSFQSAAGAAYVFERNTDTGEWTQTQKWNSPSPGFEHNFGAACALSAAGDVAVIGEANVLGSKYQGLEDGAYVSMHDGSAWGPLIELVPSPLPGNSYNFGESVAISPDGSLIAVAAPSSPAFADPPASGHVFVFENQSGSWVQIAHLTRVIPGDSFNNFGAAIGFDGDTLLVCNPSENTLGPDSQVGAPICIYEKSGGSYPSVPDELIFQQSAAPSPGGFVIRNDTMLVTRARYIGTDGLMRYDRDTDNPDRTWKFNSQFKSEHPDKFGAPTGYGVSAAIADDPEVMLVGEPFWSPPDFSVFNPGLINFPNRVFTNADFSISPGTSSMFVNFDFPGMPSQSLFVQLLGFFNLSYPLNCSGDGRPVQAVIEGFSLIPTEDEYTLDGPLGMDIVLSNVEISLNGASDPSPISDSGEATFTGMTVRIDAMVKVGVLPAFPFSAEGDQSGPMPSVVTGGSSGQPLGFSIPNLELEFNPDLGLGDNNPTVSAQGSLFTQIVETTCDADLTMDGELNFFDVSAFLVAFSSFDPIADFTGDGQYNFFDVSAFLGAFGAGCP